MSAKAILLGAFAKAASRVVDDMARNPNFQSKKPRKKKGCSSCDSMARRARVENYVKSLSD